MSAVIWLWPLERSLSVSCGVCCRAEGLRLCSALAGKDWSHAEDVRSFVRELAAEHSIEKPSDWKAVPSEALMKAGGKELLEQHEHSWLAVLKAAGEEGLEGLDEEDVRKYRPRGYWKAPAHKRRFMERIGKRLGIVEKKQWRSVSRRQLASLGGRGLLQECKGSMEHLMAEVFPEEQWTAADVSSGLSKGYWDARENRRAFLEEFAERYSIEGPEGWKAVSWEQLRREGGSGLLAKFSSIAEALQDAFPEEDYAEERCRGRLAPGYWRDRKNCRAFLDRLAAHMGVEEPSDWAHVSTVDVQKFGGSGLLGAYPTFYAALEDAYEDIGGSANLRSYRPRQPSDHWSKPGTVREFLDSVKQELCISNDEGWYRVSTTQLRELGGGGLLFRTKTLLKALEIAYPDAKWDAARMAQGSKKSAQLHLSLSVASLFPSLKANALNGEREIDQQM